MSMRVPRLLLALLLLSGAALAQAQDAAPATPGGAAAAAPPTPEDPAVQHLRALLGPEIGLRYRSATVLDGTAGDFRLEDVRLRGPGFELLVRTWTARGQREDGAREWELDPVTWYGDDGLMLSARQARLSGLAIRSPAPGQAVDLAGLIGAIRADRLAIEGAAFGLGEVSIGRLAIEDYGLGRPSRARLEDLAGQWGSEGLGSFSLASAAMDGLDIATLALLQVTGTPTGPARMRGNFLAETFAMDEAGRSVVRAGSLRGESDFEIAADGRVTSTDRMVLQGLALDEAAAAQEILTELGYQALPGEITLESRFEQQGGRFSLPGLALTLPGFGQLTFGFEGDGFDPQAAPDEVAARMRMLSLMVRYRDDGLLPRLFAMLARQGRMTVPGFRAQIIAELAALLEAPALRPLLTPAKRFLSGQTQELEVAARPQEPLGLSALEDPGLDSVEAVLVRLGLAATAR
jgi:hypothetical protein